MAKSAKRTRMPKHSNGFFNLDGSSKPAKDLAKISKLKSHSNAGSKRGAISTRALKELRLLGAKGGRASGYRTKLGVLKPKKLMNAIKKAKSLAGSVSGMSQARAQHDFAKRAVRGTVRQCILRVVVGS